MDQDQVIFVGSIVALAVIATIRSLRRSMLQRTGRWTFASSRVESTAVTLESGGALTGSAKYHARLKCSDQVQGQSHVDGERRRLVLTARRAPSRLHTCVNLLLPVLWLMCGTALAQAPPASGDYTAAMPSVEKVKAQVKGTDATDTAARQLAVFSYLQTYISRIKDARKYGGPFTPGEQKLLGDYARAAAQLS